MSERRGSTRLPREKHAGRPNHDGARPGQDDDHDDGHVRALLLLLHLHVHAHACPEELAGPAGPACEADHRRAADAAR